MKIDYFDNPPPLVIGEGEDAFRIFLKPMTGGERMAVFDAIDSKSFEQIDAATARLVVAWDGINDQSGKPIAVESANARPTNWQRVLGAMDRKAHGLVIGAILAFVGIPTDQAQLAAKMIGGGESDVRPTTKQESGTGSPASCGSASSAT